MFRVDIRANNLGNSFKNGTSNKTIMTVWATPNKIVI